MTPYTLNSSRIAQAHELAIMIDRIVESVRLASSDDREAMPEMYVDYKLQSIGKLVTTMTTVLAFAAYTCLTNSSASSVRETQSQPSLVSGRGTVAESCQMLGALRSTPHQGRLPTTTTAISEDLAALTAAPSVLSRAYLTVAPAPSFS